MMSTWIVLRRGATQLASRALSVSPMFKPHLLTEICTLYGTGPLERGELANKKNLSDAYAGRLDHPTNPMSTSGEVYMEVKWVAFVNDVGEGYMTFPPRGHGVELAPKKLYGESSEFEGW